VISFGGAQPQFAFVGLLEQPGVVDGDAPGGGQRADGRVIVLGELRAAALPGQIEVAEVGALGPHRTVSSADMLGRPGGTPNDRGRSTKSRRLRVVGMSTTVAGVRVPTSSSTWTWTNSSNR